MVVICVKGDMITAKNNQRIRTRNYTDWKLLKDGCRQSAMCDDSDDEDAFDPDEFIADEHLRGADQPNDSGDTEPRWAKRDRPRRKITSTKDSKYNARISFAIKIKETAGELTPWKRTLAY